MITRSFEKILIKKTIKLLLFISCTNPLVTRQIKLPTLNGDYEPSQLQKYVARPYNSEDTLTWYQIREKEVSLILRKLTFSLKKI